MHGVKLKSYEFNVYKSKKNKKLISLNVIGHKNKLSTQRVGFLKYQIDLWIKGKRESW